MARKLSLYEPLARTDPIRQLLSDHLVETAEICRSYADSEILWKTTEKKIPPQMWKDIAFIIGISHDLGKAKVEFQKKLIEQTSKHVEHSLLSSFFTYFLLKKYFSKCGKIDEYWAKLTLTAATLAVASHHSRLCNLCRGEELGKGVFLTERYGEEKEDEKRLDLELEVNDLLRNPQLDLFIKKIDSVLKKVCGLEKALTSIIKALQKGFFHEMTNQLVNTIKEVHQVLKFSSGSRPNLNFYFLTIYLYSILTDADVSNACGLSKPVPRSKQRKHLTPKLIEAYLKSSKFAEKRQLPLAPLRNQVLMETKKTIKQLNLKKNKLLALTVPTGLGKTLSALYAGLEIRCREPVKGEPRRIIYAAPFLSIVDQTADQVQKILTQINPEPAADLMLVHHHLADIKYPVKEVSEEKLSSYGELLLFESWNSEIILTTFSQLLESLVNNRRGAIRKIHRIPHSIILLDEIQAIPIELWELVDEIFNFLVENWDCYLIFLTATMPKIIKRELAPLVAKRGFKL
ncbi:MAG TPA: CRISPR-associated endonuclease Cas3'', partial [Thermococcus sp.]|nr:CRISPR-associated endonuclease Cas3'' [Thermococcus sp.]